MLRPKRLLSKIGTVTLALLLLSTITFTTDVLRLNVAEQAASAHLYSVVQWEFANFFDKWIYRALSLLDSNSPSEMERIEIVYDYFALTGTRSTLEGQLSKAIANGDSKSILINLDSQLAAIDRSRERIRPTVEETLESLISAVLEKEGLASVGGLIFPPVDFHLTQPPYVLITSPRDRIERGEEALLKSDIDLNTSLAIEEELLNGQNLSALVIPIAGVATYPASVLNNRGLRWTLRAASHEWMHHYLFVRPLGSRMFSSHEMHILNETVAQLAGVEIGDRVFVMLGGNLNEEDSTSTAGVFNFRREMHDTRLRAEELLAQGKTLEAEAHMEERRLLFVNNGYNIRKLNQAYFAFHGTYAESAASTSPIGDQVREYRNLHESLGAFIIQIASIAHYEDFIERLNSISNEAWTNGQANQ